MKAKIKATGEIVHVGDYNTISHDPRYKDERTGPWRLEELDFADTADYWTRLGHQYAGMAMQGILSNEIHTKHLLESSTSAEEARDTIVSASRYIAHALVHKLKEKEERK